MRGVIILLWGNGRSTDFAGAPGPVSPCQAHRPQGPARRSTRCERGRRGGPGGPPRASRPRDIVVARAVAVHQGREVPPSAPVDGVASGANLKPAPVAGIKVSRPSATCAPGRLGQQAGAVAALVCRSRSRVLVQSWRLKVVHASLAHLQRAGGSMAPVS